VVRFDEAPVDCHDTSEQQRLGFLERAGHNRGMAEAP
jgi:hypothetical protein